MFYEHFELSKALNMCERLGSDNREITINFFTLMFSFIEFENEVHDTGHC